MDFERFREAWRQREYRGGLCDLPPREVAAIIRRKARYMAIREVVRDIAAMLSAVAAVVTLGYLAWTETSWLVRAGSVLIMTTVVSMLLLAVLGHRIYRPVPLDLPIRQYLTRELRRIRMQIRLRRWAAAFLAPIPVGVALISRGFCAPAGEALMILGSTTALFGIGYGLFYRRIVRQYLRYESNVRRHLAELARHA